MSILDDKIARSVEARCSHCKGGTFKLIGRAPEGLRHGEMSPLAENAFNTAECDACGESYAFARPISLRPKR